MKKETRNLILFFAATFIWTWAFYIPIVISGGSLSQMPWMILLILGGMGPSLIGVAMVLFTYDKEQRRDFWRRCFSFKAIGLPWWLFIFLVFPAVFALSIVVDKALGGAVPGMEQFKNLMASPAMWPLAAFISFMSGPWSEEFGWRGLALKPMLRRFGVIPGSIALGVIWAVWHLPLYFMAERLARPDGLQAGRLLDFYRLQHRTVADHDLGVPEYECQHSQRHAAALHLELHIPACLTLFRPRGSPARPPDAGHRPGGLLLYNPEGPPACSRRSRAASARPRYLAEGLFNQGNCRLDTIRLRPDGLSQRRSF